MTSPQTNAPHVAWLGDDFTGAAAVMEVLSFSGVPSVLFLQRPSPEEMAGFPGIKGVGLATLARARSPEWMDRNLLGLFAELLTLKPEILHYKTCTTLDSAPHVGSIGRAAEIGARAVGADVIPILIAAPPMRRYQIFGHLFAAAGAEITRIDRHPVMAQHPVTPIAESDVARHLAKQSNQIVFRCLSHETLADKDEAQHALIAGTGLRGITIDNLTEADVLAAGQLLWQGREARPFVVGSQGVEYALVRHWQDIGQLKPQPKTKALPAVAQVLAVSGSVSPVTADQIAWAGQNGFEIVRLDVAGAFGANGQTAEDHAYAQAVRAVEQGQSPLIVSAQGPNDPAVAAVRQTAAGREAAQDVIGQTLGRILDRLIRATGLRRVVVSGGDTSGEVCTQLGIKALTALAPTVPGAAICRVHAQGPMDGLEISLKGGQMGDVDHFGRVRAGGGATE